MAISDSDLDQPRRSVDLAREALNAGDHAWAGLGRIVNATSSAQPSRWLDDVMQSPYREKSGS